MTRFTQLVQVRLSMQNDGICLIANIRQHFEVAFYMTFWTYPYVALEESQKK